MGAPDLAPRRGRAGGRYFGSRSKSDRDQK